MRGEGLPRPIHMTRNIGGSMDIQPQFISTVTLLSNRLFRIPPYQRAYSWGKKQRDDMFNDILALKGRPDATHFMATVVGLRREQKTIVTDNFRVVEIVDGQQRITTLVILLKAIAKLLNRELSAEKRLAEELHELLVKQDDMSLILLQTNHDRSHYFANYIRSGEYPPIQEAETLADRELLQAFKQCEQFVDRWSNNIELLTIIKNQLTFIFHELDDEATVYTVFEVLNNRGLRVSWLDRLKSMLMAIAFQGSRGNAAEHIKELHQIWGEVYGCIGLQQGLSTEGLRFAGTLKAPDRVSKTYSEERAVVSLREECGTSASNAIEVSHWLLKVTTAVDRFLRDRNRSQAAVTDIAQARLLAVAIILRGFKPEDEKAALDLWETTSFRVFGLCRKDKRTAVGDYVRLAWDVVNTDGFSLEMLRERIGRMSKGKEHSVDWAVAHLQNENCYQDWEEELRYLLFRYEEHLAQERGQKFNNDQWKRIWEATAVDSIEHIQPQSKGALEREDPQGDSIFVHRLGNLMLLPPGLNSSLKNLDPDKKVEAYRNSGLFNALEVADLIEAEGWSSLTVERRERTILNWIEKEWK